MTDFAALPPEINSGRMYAGPGSGPMVAAAAAWNSLAINLGSAASSYGTVISGLTSGSWLGPSSALMAAAATPYVAWLNTAASQAEQASAQANAAADAYEAAFAATVPPPVIAANRSLLAALTATNILGQNTSAIGTTEAHYGEMWAQDAAAMYGYAAASATATAAPPFTAPAPTTNPAGQTGQAAGTSTASSASAATNGSSTLSGLASELNGLMSPNSDTSTSGLAGILNDLSGTNGSPLGVALNGNLVSQASNALTTGGYLNPTSFLATAAGLAGVTAAAGSEATTVGAVGSADLLGSAAVPGLGAAAVSAGVGRASLVGELSVPQSWAAATPLGPTISPAAAALPGTNLGGAPGGAPGGPGGPGWTPMAGMAGAAGGRRRRRPRYGFRPTVVAHPPAAG